MGNKFDASISLGFCVLGLVYSLNELRDYNNHKRESPLEKKNISFVSQNFENKRFERKDNVHEPLYAKKEEEDKFPWDYRSFYRSSFIKKKRYF